VSEVKFVILVVLLAILHAGGIGLSIMGSRWDAVAWCVSSAIWSYNYMNLVKDNQ
jgi:hypothetical protein